MGTRNKARNQQEQKLISRIVHPTRQFLLKSGPDSTRPVDISDAKLRNKHHHHHHHHHHIRLFEVGKRNRQHTVQKIDVQ